MNYFDFGSRQNQDNDPLTNLVSDLNLTNSKRSVHNEADDLLSAILSAPKPKF